MQNEMQSWVGCRDLAEPKKHLANQRPAEVVRFPGYRVVFPPLEPSHPGTVARRWQRLKVRLLTWLLPALVIALAFALFLATDGVRW